MNRYGDHTGDPGEIAGPALGDDAGQGSRARHRLRHRFADGVANAGLDNRIVPVEPDETRAAIARSRGFDVHMGLLDEALLRRSASSRPTLFGCQHVVKARLVD